MKTRIVLRDKEYFLQDGITLIQALESISVNPESVIAIRDGEIMDGNEVLTEGDYIRLVHVISGG